MSTVIQLWLDERSNRSLKNYLDGEEICSDRDKFYSTLWYSLTPIFKRDRLIEEINGALPLKVSPPYPFDIFSTSLILKYSNETRVLLRAGIRGEGVKQSIKGWPDLGREQTALLEKSLAVIEDYNPETDIAEVCLTWSREKKRIYFTLKPHITLAKNFPRERLNGLSKFEEELVFDDFSWRVK